jgi:hypothetical protein
MSDTPTYWNGEPCQAKRVMVVVGSDCPSTWWCASMAGTIRPAVRVRYAGSQFYLDDENDAGWRKVTVQHGSPLAYHRSLPGDSVEWRPA